MNSWLIISLSVGYLALLFLLAYWFERKGKSKKGAVSRRWIYVLALPVYCTAWTYYGSVGKAVNDGWEFLTIYVGPILTMPLWWFIVRKMIRICEIQRISTLPDFITSRYGKSVLISSLSAVFIILGIIPYISIQLKSITTSFNVLTHSSDVGELVDLPTNTFFLNDSAFYLSIILALFIVIFVFRSIETTDKHIGMMSAIAVDSVVKLVAFLAVGVYVTYGLFDGFGDIFSQAEDAMVLQFSQIPQGEGFEWTMLLLLSMSAILLLPRQFQVMVAENTNENHLKTATWSFPLYLLLINLFVVPIALAGILQIGNRVTPDAYVLSLPLINGQTGLALFTFLGGFSAATGMIIVSTISLSMITINNLIVPLTLKRSEGKAIQSKFPLLARQIAVFVILLLAYLYYKLIADKFSIVSIGLISFAAITQFVPAVFGALFWKDANKQGVTMGLIAGFVIWTYTLVLPTLASVGLTPPSIVEMGPFGISWLKPEGLFGSELGFITHGTFWSVLFNILFFFLGSLVIKQSAKERNLAEFYVDIYDYSSRSEEKLVWKGRMVYRDLLLICEKLLGEQRTTQAIEFYQKHFGNPIAEEDQVDPRFVTYTERLLSGAVGSASARILISSVSQEEEIELDDVIQILKVSSEIARLNTELKMQSQELEMRTQELEAANNRLKNLDLEKDDFISTVTHEMRTPLTSIKAFVEILQDHDDIGPEDQDRFLETINNEIDRMTRLINQVLDMEKLESGAVTLSKKPVNPIALFTEVQQGMEQLLKSKKIVLDTKSETGIEDILIHGDEDRIKQVFINLLSNSIKYSKEKKAKIEVIYQAQDDFLEMQIKDNGRGIRKDNLEHIFDKFFQARDQTRKKPKGSGLGLSITKKIVEMHGGTIRVESEWQKGTCFKVTWPILNNHQPQEITSYEKSADRR